LRLSDTSPGYFRPNLDPIHVIDAPAAIFFEQFFHGPRAEITFVFHYTPPLPSSKLS
jgi:hypothetical protein